MTDRERAGVATDPALITALARAATAFERLATAAELYGQQQAENRQDLRAILARLQEDTLDDGH